MATSDECYGQAAIRHYDDAEYLASQNRFDGAGHFIGFAAECAIKHAVESVRPSAAAPYLHLPELIDAAKKNFRGHRHKHLLVLLQMTSYFAGWTVRARYFADGAVGQVQYEQWRQHAQRTFAATGLSRARHV